MDEIAMGQVTDSYDIVVGVSRQYCHLTLFRRRINRGDIDESHLSGSAKDPVHSYLNPIDPNGNVLGGVPPHRLLVGFQFHSGGRVWGSDDGVQRSEDKTPVVGTVTLVDPTIRSDDFVLYWHILRFVPIERGS
jgi:hypothetical protein